ncbi:MAG: DUF2834 domain-containing protein [Oceanococcus sp.]
MKALLVVVFAAFAVFSGWVMLQVGYMGVWTGALDNPGSQQVLIDLVIVCVLACSWMWQDAKARGANAWPFIVLTLGAGSFGPLLYLILRKAKPSE